MIKFSALICCFLITLKNGISQNLNLNQKFFGECPEVKGKFYGSPSNNNGKWYTQWLYSDYSPSKYFPCQSIAFDFSTNRNQKITIQFAFPYINMLIPEMEGESQRNENEYYFNNDNKILANVSQKIAILEKHYSSKILVWTCLDFKIFHFESVQVMTKSPYANEQALHYLEQSVGKYGISPQSFKKVDQSC